MMYLKELSTAAILALGALAAPLEDRSAYSFKQLVAFGDELSDNGNGSYAHGITGNPAKVYGYGTWTNGPVAASYLADLLSVPLTDYAFGGCCGGGSFGATLDNNYTKSQAGSPSLVDQIVNYTTTGTAKNSIKNSLQFIWAGQNDLTKHTDAFWQGDPHNKWFANNYTSYTVASVQKLLNAGAPYVFVSNIYPKQASPVTKKYLCGNNTDCVKTWGAVIQSANSALETGLRKFGNKVIYYDVFGFMTQLLANAPSYGFTEPLDDFCDGDGDAMWQKCWVDGKGLVAPGFFWTNFVQMTTAVHQLVAADMKRVIDAHSGI